MELIFITPLKGFIAMSAQLPHTTTWPAGSFHVALTGHRPNSLPGGFDKSHPFTTNLYARLYQIMERGLAHHGHFVCHSGMALGADTTWAKVIVDLRRAHPGRFSFVAEVPLLTQADRWPDHQDRALWAQLVDMADHVNVYGQSYHPRVLFERNTGMITAADLVLAVINPSTTSGGTRHAVDQATRLGKQVFQIDPATLV